MDLSDFSDIEETNDLLERFEELEKNNKDAKTIQDLLEPTNSAYIFEEIQDEYFDPDEA